MRVSGLRLFARLLIGLAAVLPLCAARADETPQLTVLWWQVGDWEDDSETRDSLSQVVVQRLHDGGTTTAADLGVTHARIREVSSGTYLNILDMDDSGNPTDFTLASMDVPMRWVADISNFTGGSPEYAFVIELGNYTEGTWSTLAVSETATYTDLLAANNIDTSHDFNPFYVTPWNPTAYVVPEPTSGVLVLVGAALLALRCRRSASHRG